MGTSEAASSNPLGEASKCRRWGWVTSSLTPTQRPYQYVARLRRGETIAHSPIATRESWDARRYINYLTKPKDTLGLSLTLRRE